jgi:hypothetical protein
LNRQWRICEDVCSAGFGIGQTANSCKTDRQNWYYLLDLL